MNAKKEYGTKKETFDRIKQLSFRIRYLCQCFIHSRVVYYTKELDVQVLIYNPNKRYTRYQYENIPVQVTNDKRQFKHFLETYKPDIIAIHFVEAWMFKSFIKDSTCPDLHLGTWS